MAQRVLNRHVGNLVREARLQQLREAGAIRTTQQTAPFNAVILIITDESADYDFFPARTGPPQDESELRRSTRPIKSYKNNINRHVRFVYDDNSFIEFGSAPEYINNDFTEAAMVFRGYRRISSVTIQSTGPRYRSTTFNPPLGIISDEGRFVVFRGQVYGDESTLKIYRTVDTIEDDGCRNCSAIANPGHMKLELHPDIYSATDVDPDQFLPVPFIEYSYECGWVWDTQRRGFHCLACGEFSRTSIRPDTGVACESNVTGAGLWAWEYDKGLFEDAVAQLCPEQNIRIGILQPANPGAAEWPEQGQLWYPVNDTNQDNGVVESPTPGVLNPIRDFNQRNYEPRGSSGTRYLSDECKIDHANGVFFHGDERDILPIGRYVGPGPHDIRAVDFPADTAAVKWYHKAIPWKGKTDDNVPEMRFTSQDVTDFYDEITNNGQFNPDIIYIMSDQSQSLRMGFQPGFHGGSSTIVGTTRTSTVDYYIGENVYWHNGRIYGYPQRDLTPLTRVGGGSFVEWPDASSCDICVPFGYNLRDDALRGAMCRFHLIQPPGGMTPLRYNHPYVFERPDIADDAERWLGDVAQAVTRVSSIARSMISQTPVSESVLEMIRAYCPNAQLPIQQ